ncbi:unnamed protein product, partial [Staurois parvus]
VTRHQVIWLDPRGTASSGEAVGNRVILVRPRAPEGMSDILDRLTGQRASGHQASVIWLDSGHRVIWQRQWHRVKQARQWAPIIRAWIVWLDSGHQVTRYDSGRHWVTRHQVILARQRAPRHLARQWAPSHHVRQRAS